jgi:hypothetical protein
MSDIDTQSCRNLWLTAIANHMDCALNNFEVPKRTGNKDAMSIEQQYKKLENLIEKSPDKFFRYMKKPNLDCQKSRYFFETSQFDNIAIMVGYDTNFINKVFNFIQETITLEKKLWEKYNENI